MKHCIVYFSPAGTTRTVAAAIEQRLVANGLDAAVFDLSSGLDTVLGQVNTYSIQGEAICLWVGSPVYCDHAVPLVEQCIENLQAGQNSYSVPFVTWGGVTSGLALFELAEKLDQQGYRPLGAAKILAVHSSMYGAEEPLAKGHPDSTDFARISSLVSRVVEKLQSQEPGVLDRGQLDYLSPRLKADAAGKSLAAVKASMPPLSADKDRCNGCGVCAELCPVRAISMEDNPVVSDECVLCLQCIRHCPEQAFPIDHDMLAQHIQGMAAASDEEKESAIFV